MLSLVAEARNPTDQEVLVMAAADARVVLTEDTDFGTHIFQRTAGFIRPHPSRAGFSAGAARHRPSRDRATRGIARSGRVGDRPAIANALHRKTMIQS
ncbi:MAG: hypothetical protein KBA31_05190 [Alphaproteobacteria bacterium]|nr:hypothetical protein [Alphaproteobacteria bacterium]